MSYTLHLFPLILSPFPPNSKAVKTKKKIPRVLEGPKGNYFLHSTYTLGGPESQKGEQDGGSQRKGFQESIVK